MDVFVAQSGAPVCACAIGTDRVDEIAQRPRRMRSCVEIEAGQIRAWTAHQTPTLWPQSPATTLEAGHA
jgi:hypothetical protein